MMTLRAPFLFVAAALMLAFAPTSALAQSPPIKQPQLVIDPGMHTAGIIRIGADATCSLLATGSLDKTVRLWEMPEGRLLRTLRPPIGPGFEGRINGVAMAPDGSWVAAGGWDAAYASMKANFVYVFHTATGRIATRLGPLGNVILHLAVSPDGKYLAAGLGGGQGLRVWERSGTDLASWRLIAEDKDYDGKEVYGAIFGPDNVLYSVAYDGRLRRYTPNFSGKPLMIATRGGKRPFSVAVHPSNDRLAVGFVDSTVVEVYDTATLAWRFAADTTGVTNGNLGSVAWSTDGTRLYASGRFEKNQKISLRVWEQAGQGAFRELDGPLTTIMHLLPCRDSIFFGAVDPALGLYGPDGSHQFWQDNVQADMRAKLGEHFKLSRDGHRVRFGLEIFSRQPVVFDVDRVQLSDSPQADADMFGPEIEGASVTDWRDNYSPKLAGKPLKLDQHEMSRALAVAPNKQRVVLGTEWQVRTYGLDAKQIWSKQVPGIVWGVNISRDGNLVTAAYGDGTIRWHRLDNGRELLALFVQAKDKRWVAWTPKGYYTASAGGENLIGWVVNRGWNEAADYFPAARFRDQFYRPDIVKLVLNTLDEDEAIKQANEVSKRKRDDEEVSKRLPPVINIVSPVDGTDIRGNEITIEYTIRSPSKIPITGVRAFIDDRPTGEGQKGIVPVSLGDSKLTMKVQVPPHDSTFSLIASTEFGASEPARVRLRWAGPKIQEDPPTLYALVIGVAKYKDSSLNLTFAAKDADDFAAELMNQQGKAYKKVVVRKLTDPDATERNIRLGLEWLGENVKARNDRAVLFFSGHGVTTPQLTSYLLPEDVETNKLIATGLNKRVILDVLRALPARVLVFLDACHAAGGLDATGMRRLDTSGLVNEFSAAENGIVSFVSSQGDQLSYEDPAWKNGAFTKALVEGLSGGALASGEKEILTIDLYSWLLRKVQTLTNHRQTPIYSAPPNIAPFSIALRR